MGLRWLWETTNTTHTVYELLMDFGAVKDESIFQFVKTGVGSVFWFKMASMKDGRSFHMFKTSYTCQYYLG